jgi:ferredoxin, 2Fe-2S
MIVLNVIDRAGAKQKLEVSEGSGLMEVLRDNNLGLEAICGGCCSCATCHVFIAPTPNLAERGKEESELLEGTLCYRADESRLACQIKMTEALDGLEVTVAPAY